MILIVLAIGAAIGLAGLGLTQAITGVNLFGLPSSSTSSGQVVTVSMPNGVGINQTLNYVPVNVTIAKNGAVKWTNNDSVHHTATSTSVPSGASSGFDSKDMGQGATYQVTLSVSGTYKYVCAYHSWMQGTITVTG